MSKILFLNIADYDHVYSTLGLVHELIKKGEEVIYSTSDNFKKEIEYVGARFKCTNYSSGPLSGPPFLQQQSLMDVMYSSIFYNIKRKNQLMELIFDEVQELKPDYIIFDYRAFWGKEITRKLDIPAICVFPGMVINKKIFYTNPTEFIRWCFGGLYQTNSKEIEKIISVLNRVFKNKYKLDDISEGLIIDADLNIVYTNRFIQPFVDLLDDNYHFAGYSLYYKKLQEVFPGSIPGGVLPGEKNMIYVTATPADKYHVQWNARFYPLLFQALKNDRRQVVMNYQCHDQDYYQLGEVPGNFFVGRFWHHGKLIDHSGLVITSGSYCTVHESLLHGVPMIVIPVGSEQFLVAQKIEDLKLGIYLRPTSLTVESLRDAVSALQSDNRYKENCRHYGELIRNHSEDARAAEIVLDYIKSAAR
ncbi:nucleotide disphospho-sugar-binding domain-containing protein [Acidobacteriota bacterium]